MIIRIASIIMNFLIGLWIYFFLANRIISVFKDSGLKTFAVIFCFLFLMTLSAISSIFLTNIWFFYIQICITVFFCAGELYRALLWKYFTSAGPLNRISYYDSLYKPITTRNIKFYEYNIQIDKWKGKSLTIAHISDLHISNKEDVDYYESISRELTEYTIDYLFITGDFVSEYCSFQFLGTSLSTLCSKYKTFAVLGNHDYWVGSEKVADILRRENINLLKNNYNRVAGDSQTFFISGFDKPWGMYNYSAHVFPETGDAMHLCLCHNPDNIYKLSQQNIDIVFAGHYHAGEIRLPGFGALIVPSRYGRRFTHGHFILKNTHLFVTAGTGSSIFRTRIYCNPDVFIVHIKGHF